MQELKNSLEHVFGDSLKSFHLEMKRENQPVFSIHGPIYAFMGESYVLTVNVNINVVDLVKTNKSLNWMKLLTIGDIVPHSVCHTQDLNGLSSALRAEYNVSNLNHFILELDNLAWNRFNTLFTKQLEKVLSDDKENN